MSPSRLAGGFTPEVRASIYHSSVFGAGAAAAISFGIWMSDRNISSDQIGLVNAVPVFLMLIINLFVGRLADKASDWKQMIVVLSMISGGAAIGLYFVDDFWGVLLIWTLFNLPSGSIPPLIDAATLRMAQRNGSDFGSIRAWGTVGYVAATAIAAGGVAMFGHDAFVTLFVVMSLLRAALAWQLPRFRAPAHETTVAEIAPRTSRLTDMIVKPWFLLPLIAFGLVQSAHAILGSFAALVWKQQGVPEIALGPIFAMAAVAEAVLMFVWTRMGVRISARHMILASAAVTVFRWTVMAFEPAVPVLLMLQCLHAITYALGYFGLVHFIANWTSEDIAAEAQGFAFALQQGITVVVLIGFGWLMPIAQDKAFLAVAALGLVATACVLASLRLQPAK